MPYLSKNVASLLTSSFKNSRLNEQNIEKRNEGDIFIGIVKNILVGMESAFVDIGTSKKGYIHLQDLLPKRDEGTHVF